MGREGNQTGLANADTVLLFSHLSFARSGLYRYTNDSLGYQSSNGYFWSATSSTSKIHTYILDFGSIGFLPHNIFNHGYGFSLRCLAH